MCLQQNMNLDADQDFRGISHIFTKYVGYGLYTVGTVKHRAFLVIRATHCSSSYFVELCLPCRWTNLPLIRCWRYTTTTDVCDRRWLHCAVATILVSIESTTRNSNPLNYVFVRNAHPFRTNTSAEEDYPSQSDSSTVFAVPWYALGVTHINTYRP